VNYWLITRKSANHASSNRRVSTTTSRSTLNTAAR
jgi:hypothetical protein